MKTAFVYKLIYRLILWASAAYFLTTAAGQLFALLLVVVEKPLNFDPFGHAELSLFAKI